MPSPTDAEPYVALRSELAGLMRTIAQREPDPAFEASDDMRCMSDALLGDSLDVLEFVVALDRDYGVSIRDGNVGRDVLRDLGTLTHFVLDHGRT